MQNVEHEIRLANDLLKACRLSVVSAQENGIENNRLEKTLQAPGVMMAISMLMSTAAEHNFPPHILMMNVFRLGAMVAYSINDAESIGQWNKKNEM